MATPSLQQTLDSLVIPTAFARHDRITDTAILNELYAWKSNVAPLLDQLDSFDVHTLTVPQLAELVNVLTPLTVVAPWSSPSTRSLASGILFSFSRTTSLILAPTARLAKIPSSNQLIAHILSRVVKPLFAPTPHPRLHTSTGRILPRPADVQDTYVEQPWKEHPGLNEVIRWCLLNTESSAYESAWPLFLPPVMSFLDDYQVPYKFLGVHLVSDMLSRVHPELLLRTGVDSLIFNSLTNSLSHMGNQSTPDFILSTVTTTLQLIDLTTPTMSSSYDILSLKNESQNTPSLAPAHILPSSQSKSLSTRFSRLSFLLSSSLLGTVIMYTPTFLPPTSSSASDADPFADPEHAVPESVEALETPLQVPEPRKQSFNPTLVAAAQSLPPILSALGIGGARFLKGVIPVLAEWLALPPPVITTKVAENNERTALNHAREKRCGSESSTVDVTLHLASLSSLAVLMHTCAPRIGGWSTTIVDAIGQCWVRCVDIEDESRGNLLSQDGLCVLKKQLKETAIQLAKVNPSVIKNEYAKLLAFDKALFEGLVLKDVEDLEKPAT